MIQNLISVLVLSLLLISVICDLRTFRIPNQLIGIGLILGLFTSTFFDRWMGLLSFVEGVVPVVILLFPLFAIRVIGAGDIKLFALVGGFVGTSVWSIVLYAFLAGGILSAFHLLYHHNLVTRIIYFRNYIYHCIQARTIFPYESQHKKTELQEESREDLQEKTREEFYEEINTEEINTEDYKKARIHFSIPIFIGFCLWMIKRQVIG